MPPRESTIRLMTRLAIEHNAVNLSQGITDEPAAYELIWGGFAAALGGTDEGLAHLETLTLGQIAQEQKLSPDALLNLSLKDLLSRLHNTQDRFSQYSYPFGLPELREAIADYTARFYGLRPNPETQITVTLGATEALSSVLRAVCKPGDGIVIFQPFHEMYPAQANLFGLQPRYVTLRENSNTGTWDLDREELAATVPGARVLILNTPHNPTGKVFTEDELHFIADLCEQHNLLLITDEIYEHILFDNRTHHLAAAFNNMAERTFIINAISKTGNATGWRIGWVISPEAFTPQIRAIHDTLVIQAPTPLQKGAERLLRLNESFYRKIHTHYVPKRNLLHRSLITAGFQVSPPEGAYYFFANYRQVPALKHLEPMDAALFLIREIGVASVPGDNFYRTGDEGKNYLRFSFCRKLETLQEATRRLAKLSA
ncbi:MAG: aminotransferase class I/II-fold pyridoxal phosphate-dependent enzyme [bacterium]|nr:aminotransferase class I/II-fold pyridoxal phosphate-dependent enzyme [bacterium]